MQDEYHEVFWVLITSTLVFIALTGIVIFILLAFQKRRLQYQEETLKAQQAFQQQLMLSHIETQEYTSAALSQELHDNVGQLLSSTKMLLGVGYKRLNHVSEPLIMAEKTLSEAIVHLRSLSKSLNKEWLSQFDIIKNIEMEKERINASKGISIAFKTSYSKLPLTSEEQVMLFRVIQELLQNAIKHSKAENIAISINEESKQISITVKDNGVGFDANVEKNKSLGLRNMETRVKLLNGNIEWINPNVGTLAMIKIPNNISVN